MSIKVEIKETKPTRVAFIKVKGHFSLIPATFGKLYGWIGKKGFKPQGSAVAVYYNIPGQVPDSELEWELRSEITGDVPLTPPDGEGLGVKQTSPVLVAATVHKGPYEKLEETYNALIAWINENGYEVNGPPEELYFNDPAKVPPEEILTEIRFPVRKKE